MKVLFLVRSMNYGGAECQLVALAKGLRGMGHLVSVALFYGGGPLEAELRDAGVVVRPLGKSGRWDLVGFLSRLARLVREERPDVVHGYLVEPNILTLFLKAVDPAVKTVWGVRASARDLRLYDRFIRLAFRLECFLSRYADLIIANSESGCVDHVARGFPAGKMLVIANGIDTERFRPDSEGRWRIRAELGVGENDKLVGLVARLDPMKDHETFLRAAALVVEQRPDVRFLCVGDGPAQYGHRLRSLADDLRLTPRLTWASARPDVAVVYRALDILASASRWGEGFSNVVGEAMACEVPCVVTDVGDSRLIVGDSGTVVPPEDAEALALGVQKLLDEGPARLAERGAEARARILTEFSIERLVQRTEKALLGLLPRVPGYSA